MSSCHSSLNRQARQNLRKSTLSIAVHDKQMYKNWKSNRVNLSVIEHWVCTSVWVCVPVWYRVPCQASALRFSADADLTRQINLRETKKKTVLSNVYTRRVPRLITDVHRKYTPRDNGVICLPENTHTHTHIPALTLSHTHTHTHTHTRVRAQEKIAPC